MNALVSRAAVEWLYPARLSTLFKFSIYVLSGHTSSGRTEEFTTTLVSPVLLAAVEAAVGVGSCVAGAKWDYVVTVASNKPVRSNWVDRMINESSGLRGHFDLSRVKIRSRSSQKKSPITKSKKESPRHISSSTIEHKIKATALVHNIFKLTSFHLAMSASATN